MLKSTNEHLRNTVRYCLAQSTKVNWKKIIASFLLWHYPQNLPVSFTKLVLRGTNELYVTLGVTGTNHKSCHVKKKRAKNLLYGTVRHKSQQSYYLKKIQNTRAPLNMNFLLGSYYYDTNHTCSLCYKKYHNWVLWAYRPSYDPTDLQTYYIELLGVMGRLVLCSCVKKYQMSIYVTLGVMGTII